MANININSEVADQFYRYKMPRLIAKVNTWNNSEVADQFYRYKMPRLIAKVNAWKLKIYTAVGFRGK